jgi:hypothetical protein
VWVILRNVNGNMEFSKMTNDKDKIITIEGNMIKPT